MRSTGSSDEAKVAAACAALAPYCWRGLTPERLARSVVAAWDRESIRDLLEDLPGAQPGAWLAVEPADAADPRLPGLVSFLTSHPWTSLSLDTLCRTLLDRLAADSGRPDNPTP